MKVLFAIKSLNVEGGGAEKVLVQVAEGLLLRGHEVNVLTFDFPGEAFYDLPPEIRRLDMSCNPAGQPAPHWKMLNAAPRMRAAVRNVDADIVIPFMHSTLVGLAPALIGARAAVVFSEHSDYSHYKSRPYQYCMMNAVRSIAKATTIPSINAAGSFPEKQRDSYTVIPNPIDVGYWGSYANSSTESPEVIVSVGRMFEEKDHSVAIDAFALVASDYPNWSFRIIGDGPLRGRLEAQVASLGLQGRIKMPGSTRDVGAAYSKARFVVLPSRYESFGMVAAEALAAGRAVLSFDDCLGIAELVQSGQNGLLVAGASQRESRVAALAAGLRRLMSDPAYCASLGVRGPASVERYGLDPVLDRWEEVIDRATSMKRNELSGLSE